MPANLTLVYDNGYPFTDDIAAALGAFRTDPSYAVQIARAAVTIQRKRDAWAVRRSERAA